MRLDDKDVDIVVQSFDENGDGRIDRREFEAFISHEPESNELGVLCEALRIKFLEVCCMPRAITHGCASCNAIL